MQLYIDYLKSHNALLIQLRRLARELFVRNTSYESINIAIFNRIKCS
jgi:hypothetical protein